MPDSFPPSDWPFETLKLGEYFSLARQAARLIREQSHDVSQAVEQVLNGRSVTDRERSMLRQKATSIVVLGLEDE